MGRVGVVCFCGAQSLEEASLGCERRVCGEAQACPYVSAARGNGLDLEMGVDGKQNSG